MHYFCGFGNHLDAYRKLGYFLIYAADLLVALENISTVTSEMILLTNWFTF